MEDTPAVQINHLVKEFPSPFRKTRIRAVDDVSLTIMPGEVYGLIGPNGSGKSTTMKALLGLLRPTAGSLLCLWQKLSQNRFQTRNRIPS